MDIIYLITDTLTNLKYVGSKKDWLGEGTYYGSPNCKSKKNKKYYLQQKWKEAIFNRKETFSFSILEQFDKVSHKELLAFELYWQKQLNVVRDLSFINAGYAKKGYLGNIFETLNKEEAKLLKEKIKNSINQRYSKMSEDEKKKIFGKSNFLNANFGKKWSDDKKRIQSEKIKKYYKTHKNTNLGKTFEELYGKEKAKFLKENLKLKIQNRGISKEKNPFYGKKHSEETKINLKKIWVERAVRKINIDGIIYSGASEASRILNLPRTTIFNRCKNPKFPTWNFVQI